MSDDPHRLFAEFSADDLRRYAYAWEREDAEEAAAEAALDAEVEELARWLHRKDWPSSLWDDFAAMHPRYLTRARDLIAAGWRKQATT